MLLLSVLLSSACVFAYYISSAALVVQPSPEPRYQSHTPLCFILTNVPDAGKWYLGHIRQNGLMTAEHLTQMINRSGGWSE